MIDVASDFSGLGAFEEALKRLNVKHRIVFACDKDKYAKASYLANHSPEIFYDDITTRNQSQTPYSDIYCFGFPCQAFSLAGNRKGFEDTRGTLFFNSLEYIKEKQPLCFIAENVKGLLSHDKGKTFSVIRDALGVTINGQLNLHKYDDCIGYHIYYKVLNSKKYGIPQNRERIFIVGFKNAIDAQKFNYPKTFKLELRLKDMLEKKVDEKYYLSKDMLEKIYNWKSNQNPLDKIFNGEDIMSCVLARGDGEFHAGMKLIKDEIIKEGYVTCDTQAAQIYSIEGISPSISAGTHGYALGYIKEPTIVDMRGRNMVDGKRKDIKGAKTNQQLEFNINGTSNCITSVQKDNLVLEQKMVKFGTSQDQKLSPTNGVSQTISAGHFNQPKIFDNYRIRRLTPKEVFRLMGYKDDFFDKCENITSDTQLYKQGGNSIVVDTIMYLLIEVLKSIKIDFEFKELKNTL